MSTNLLKNPFKNINRYSGQLYHGTTKESAAKIMTDNFTMSSKNTLHLGQGVYFYDNEIYAIWWTLRDYMKKQSDDIEELDSDTGTNKKKWEEFYQKVYGYFEERFAVIETCFENVRCLDLDNVKNKLTLEEIYVKFYRKTIISKELKGLSVYEFLFKCSNFKDEYDMIVLTTNNYSTMIGRPKDHRLFPYMNLPYRIYCLKNIKAIKSVEKINIELENIEDCIHFVVLKNKLYEKKERRKMYKNNRIREISENYKFKEKIEDEANDGTISRRLVQGVFDFLDSLTDEEFERMLDECGNNDDNVPNGPFHMSREDYERVKDMDPETAVRELGW
ncbi:hypothetical protein [Methanolapillus millepedarum]|uniref:Uncharacterized protein n=1 Tax=Methanolapillus millepedarum TaxID=3028296 RepID=A0AA96ZUU3_9EURY|nr:hypothetical protein MsAc7_15710 [Methanosarcinaceae archaeon Ac7]